MTAHPPDLLARLERLRARVRRLLAVIGLSWTLAGIVLAGMLAVTADYLLDLPAVLRGLFLLTGLAGAGAAIYLLVIRPLRLPLSVAALAEHLEGRFKSLDDRLATAVHFLLRPTGESPALVQAALANAQASLARVPLEQAVNTRPARHAALAALGAVVFGGLLVGLDPASARLGVTRLVAPWSAAAWPKWVQIAALTGSAKVPLGESFTAEARFERGDKPSARLSVVTTDARGVVDRRLMSRQPDGRYLYVFEGLTAPLSYYFEARGDSTADRPAQLAVVERPRVAELTAAVTPPAYVTTRPLITEALDRGSATYTAGSRVELTVRANNPLAFGPGGSALVPVVAGGATQPAALPLTPDERDPAVGRVSLVLDAPLTFRAALVDHNALTNRDAGEFRLVPRPDEVPTVVITEPRPEIERTANALVRVLGTAEDDFAIQSLVLPWSLQGAAPDSPVGASIDLLGKATTEPRGTRVQSRFALDWDLGTLATAAGPVGLKPGDVVVYHVAAGDNFVGPDGQRHAAGRSADYRIRIVTPERIAQLVRDEIAAVKSRGRQLLLEQVALKDDSDLVQKDVAAGRPLTDADREQLSGQQARQARLSAQARGLAQQVQDIRGLLEENKIPDPEGKAQLGEVGRELEEVSREAMGQAARSLQEARDAAALEAQQQQMAGATGKQQQAVGDLQKALAKLERWGEFSDILRKAQDLLDRQQELNNRTGQAAGRLVGKPADKLSDAEKKELARLATEQEQTRKEADELLQRMGDLKERTAQQDPAASDALERAKQAGQEQDVAGQMGQAAEQTRSNQLSQAQDSQQKAQGALSEMIKQLQSRQDRELAELSKRLGELREAVEQLKKQQEQLVKENEATQKEADAQARQQQQADQAGRQEQLRRNAAQVAQQIADMPKADQAAGATRQASSKMGRAASKLSGGQGGQAQEDQKSAAEDLQRAVDELAKLEKQAQEEQAKRSQQAIRERLTALKTAQEQVLAQTVAIEKRRQDLGRLLRKDQAVIGELKAAQEAWLKQLAEARALTREAEVFDWTLGRCAADGQTLVGQFDNQQTGAVNQETQGRIIQRLGDLVAALQQDESSEPFKQEGGGGGGGGGQKAPPVPPLAELKMLRALQAKINEGTVAADRRHNQGGEVKTEQGLNEVKRIGTEQAELKALTERKVQQLQEQAP